MDSHCDTTLTQTDKSTPARSLRFNSATNWDLRVGFPSFSFALFSHLASSPQQKTPEFVKTPWWAYDGRFSANTAPMKSNSGSLESSWAALSTEMGFKSDERLSFRKYTQKYTKKVTNICMRGELDLRKETIGNSKIRVLQLSRTHFSWCIANETTTVRSSTLEDVSLRTYFCLDHVPLPLLLPSPDRDEQTLPCVSSSSCPTRAKYTSLSINLTDEGFDVCIAGLLFGLHISCLEWMIFFYKISIDDKAKVT